MRPQKNRRGGLTQPKVTENEQNYDHDTDDIENISTHKILLLLCSLLRTVSGKMTAPIRVISPSSLTVFAAQKMSGWLASGSWLFTGFRDGFERAQVRSDLIGCDEVQ